MPRENNQQLTANKPVQRFFLPHDAFHGEQVIFPSDIARQMRSVLRLHPGDEVLALDGRGNAYRVALTHVEKSQVGGRILARMAATGEPAGALILCQAISKGERFEWVLQKGTELGVTIFQPIITQRTLRRQPGEGRWERWRRIIREAAEQSERGRLPQLLAPLSFAEALAGVQGVGILPAVSAQLPVRAALANATWPVTLFVGPEGGFDPAEVEQARAAGVIPVTLGPRILRTETAAISLVTLTMAVMGEMDRPGPRA